MRFAIALAALSFAVSGCGGAARTPGPATATGAPSSTRAPQGITFDPTPLYKQAGLLARGAPFPFLGRVGYLASATPDSTHVVVALSLANSALSFAREADNRFRARYTVTIGIQGPAGTAAQAESREEVVVGSFRETQRADESVIFQEILDVPPGAYRITVAVRDEGSQRSAQDELALRVPRLGAGAVAPPIPIAEVSPRAVVDSLPRLLASPRATVFFGRDSIIPVYVEQYGATPTPLQLVVRNERGRVLFTDSVSLTPRGAVSSRVIEVPVSRIGIGLASIAVVPANSPDTIGAGVFVAFGEDLPVATYEEMLNYLRFFAAPYRLTKLREAPDEARAAEWATFVKETDGQGNTTEHEELRAYFGRLARASARFREEGTPGWLTDRGRVFVALGDPDQFIEPSIQDLQRNRQQLWEYRSLNLQLVFYDQTGTGRWRLTQTSAVRFESEFRRRLK